MAPNGSPPQDLNDWATAARDFIATAPRPQVAGAKPVNQPSATSSGLTDFGAAARDFLATAPKPQLSGAQPVPQPSANSGGPASSPQSGVAAEDSGSTGGPLGWLASMGRRVGQAFQASANEMGAALDTNTQVDPAIAKALPAVAAGVSVAPLRAPGQLIGGALDTGIDAGKFVSDAIHHTQIKAPANPIGHANGGSSWADALSFRQTLGQVGDPTANQTATELAATAIPTMIGGGGLFATASKAALGAAAGFNPQGDTPEARMVDRAKQATIAGVTTLGAETLPLLLSSPFVANLIGRNALTKIVGATPGEVAQDALDRTYGVLNTQAGREAQQSAEMKAAEASSTDMSAEAASPTEGGADGNAPSSSDSAGVQQGSEKPQAATKSATSASSQASSETTPSSFNADDANGLLSHSGADFQVTPQDHPVTTDGRIVVLPDAKQALDQAGTGRAFAAANDPYARLYQSDADEPTGHLKEVGPDGSSRVVGQILPSDMESVRAAAEEIAKNPEAINTPADHPVGQFNLRPLGSSDNVAAYGRAMAEQLPAREPATWAEWLSAAKEMGTGDNPADIVLQAASMAGHVDQLPQAMTWLRLQSKSMNDSMARLLDTDWSTVPLGDNRWGDALTAYHNSYSVMQSLRVLKTKVAQGLNAAGLSLTGPRAWEAKIHGIGPEDAHAPQAVPDFDTYSDQFGKTPADQLEPYPLGTMPSLPRNPDEFQRALDLWRQASANGPDALNGFWKGVTFTPSAWRYLQSSFANWYVGGLVSRMSTFARDLVGPGILSTYRTLEKSSGSVVRAGIDAASPATAPIAAALQRAPFEMMRAVGASLEGDPAKVSLALSQAADAWRAHFATFTDFTDSLRLAYQTARTGESSLRGPQPYDFDARGIPQSLIDAASSNRIDQGMYQLGNLLNVVPNAIHSLHAGVNELALNLAYLGETRMSALTAGRGLGLDGDDLSNYAKQAVMSSKDPSGAATDMSQLQNAERTTFTKPVFDPQYQPMRARALSTWQSMTQQQPALRFLLPIFKVPANGLGEQLRRMGPLGLMFKETQADLRGLNGSIAQAEAYGRVMMGTATLGAGYSLANAGLLTGAGPADPKDRAAWQAAGFQPWSIKVGDRWYDYHKLDVVGAQLGLMASFFDHTVYHAGDDDNLYKMAMGTVSGLAEYAKDQSAFSGVADLLSFGANPGEDQGRARAMVDGFAQGFVPGFVQEARDMADPYKRVERDPIEAITNAIPFASKTLDPIRNLYGEAVHVPLFAALLPVTTSAVNPHGPDEPGLMEMNRLFTTSGSVPGTISTALPGGHMDMRDIKLEDGSSLYDALMRYRQYVKNDDGQTLKEAIASTIQSDEYKAGFDGSIHGEHTFGDQTNRSALLYATFHDFDKLAKAQVAVASPIAARYLAVGAAKRTQFPGANLHSTTEFVQNPGLARALGIDLEGFEDNIKAPAQ
jgi:hypothetical protein